MLSAIGHLRIFAVAIAALNSMPSAKEDVRIPPDSAFHVPETPDEKGRTPSMIAEEIQKDRAIAAKREAQRAKVQEERRQAVSLRSNESDCLAYLPSEYRCLVTVGEFNRRLAVDLGLLDAIKDSLDMEKQVMRVRGTILTVLLDERFIEATLNNQGNIFQAQVQEAWRGHIAKQETVIGEARLRRLFQERKALFGSKRKAKLEFLGSSDSSFLEAILNCFSDSRLEKVSNGKVPLNDPKGEKCGLDTIFKWGKLHDGDLPESLSQVVSELGKGEFTKVIRGEFGWFVIAVAGEEVVPALTYEQSLPLLIYLANSPESAIETEAMARLAKNHQQKTPARHRAGLNDPVIQVWLLPGKMSKKKKNPDRQEWSDTALVRSISIRTSSLPPDVQCEALSAMQLNSRGIIKSRFGTFYFKAESKMPTSKYEDREHCNRGGEPQAAVPNGLVQIMADLSSKEKDFKRNFLDSLLSSAEPGKTGNGGLFSLRTRWVSENVSLAENLLKQF